MDINLTPIIQAVIALLAALVTYRLIPWIKERTSTEQQANLQALVRVLVYAAEQIYGAGNGPQKLDYVCKELKERGYEVDLSEIEAAVYRAFNDGVPMLRPAKDAEPKSDRSEGMEGGAGSEPEAGKQNDGPGETEMRE